VVGPPLLEGGQRGGGRRTSRRRADRLLAVERQVLDQPVVVARPQQHLGGGRVRRRLHPLLAVH
jgi:hypothetical protein